MTYYVTYVKTTPKNREVHGSHFIKTPKPIKTKLEVSRLHETIAVMDETEPSRIIVLDWKPLEN